MDDDCRLPECREHHPPPVIAEAERELLAAADELVEQLRSPAWYSLRNRLDQAIRRFREAKGLL